MKKPKQKFLKNNKPLDAIGGQKDKIFPRLRYMQPKFHSVQRRPQGSK